MKDEYIYIYLNADIGKHKIILQMESVVFDINKLKVGKILAVRDHNNPFYIYEFETVKVALNRSPKDFAYKVKVLEKNSVGWVIKVKLIEEVK